MTTTRTPEQEAIYQQFVGEATEVILTTNRRISDLAGKETTFCGPGCSACCFQIFRVQPVAFEVILHRVVNDPVLRQRFEENNAQRKALIETHMEQIKKISQVENDEEFSREWIKLRIPCALLSEGKCMVYDVRPSICASYISLSPPRVCAIDPKGYMPKAIAVVRQEFGMALANLQIKYNMLGENLFDLSWHLDHRLNPPQEEPVKKRKKKI